MRAGYEELDFRRTGRGDLLLRRRRVAGLSEDWIYEVKLDDDLLMSSLLTDSERALAGLSLSAVVGEDLSVLVGGLGLGETADAVLADDRVASVVVVEIFSEVVDWHRRELVPLGARLTGDPRCSLAVADFFRALADPAAAGLTSPDGGWDAILVDIDHAPDSWLNADHAAFYDEAGLAQASGNLAPGGVFGFWSSGRSAEEFLDLLRAGFETVAAHEITVDNPLIGEEQTDTIYVAGKGGAR